jgi:hypothetical protein
VRQADEIIRARDLLALVMRGEIPRRVMPWTTPADEVTLRTAASVFAWLLGDEEGEDFAALLELLERARIRGLTIT